MKAVVIRYALRGYKRWISPMLPNACRFFPTCSEYALEAVERHGALRGSWLAAGRLFAVIPLRARDLILCRGKAAVHSTFAVLELGRSRWRERRSLHPRRIVATRIPVPWRTA